MKATSKDTASSANSVTKKPVKLRGKSGSKATAKVTKKAVQKGPHAVRTNSAQGAAVKRRKGSELKAMDSQVSVEASDTTAVPWTIDSLLDRDLSLLAFNRRVLSWAARVDVPVLERLRYLVIVSSNLDELFEVRMAPHLRAFKNEVTETYATPTTFEKFSASAHELVCEQYRLYNELVLPALERKGVKLVTHDARNKRQQAWVKNFFAQEVQPLLIPVALDPAHPFPQVANKSLNYIVKLTGKDVFGRENNIAIVRVPRSLPRFIRMPGIRNSKAHHFVSISSVIRSHLQDLFPGRQVTEFSQFRVTRNSDLELDEQDSTSLRLAVKMGLHTRHYGQAVRLEVNEECSEGLADLLLNQFGLPASSLFRVAGPVNLVRMSQLVDLVDSELMRFPPHVPSWTRALSHSESIFSQLQKAPVLMHHPYESFDPVLAFLREAVRDPQVVAIKQTIYRIGGRRELLDLLCEGVRRGIDVTAVVELKARFDEENNVTHAELLEAAGVQVVYGVVGLKTHAKMMLVTRKEGRKLARYAHVGTGNYNASTAKAYTDIGMMTADPTLTNDVEQIFLHLANPSRVPKLRKALCAPFTLHASIIKKIEQTAEAARGGAKAVIQCKMNSLTDIDLAMALHRAAEDGVKIDLIVRGACILPPSPSNSKAHLKIVSIIGRFLEHSRVYHFDVDGKKEVWLSSADFMNRNMMRRIELAWPVEEPNLQLRVVRECISMALEDQVDGWVLDTAGNYSPLRVSSKKKRQAGVKGGLSMQSQLALTYQTA